MFLVRSRECVSCPVCGAALEFRDRCRRHVADSHGSRITLWIRRLRCTECGRLHRELPGFVVPFKQYVASVIEAAIESRDRVFCAEDSTIRRWRRWFSRAEVHFFGVLAAAAAETGTPLPKPPEEPGSLLQSIWEHLGKASGWLKKLCRITVNTHNWVCTEFAFLAAE